MHEINLTPPDCTHLVTLLSLFTETFQDIVHVLLDVTVLRLWLHFLDCQKLDFSVIITSIK